MLNFGKLSYILGEYKSTTVYCKFTLTSIPCERSQQLIVHNLTQIIEATRLRLNCRNSFVSY